MDFDQIDMCIDIVDILFWIANGQMPTCDRVICQRLDNGGVLSFHVLYIHSSR